MSDYRRWFLAGGTYFFTLVTYQRRPLFAEKNARRILGNCFREARQELPFSLSGFCRRWELIVEEAC